MEKFFYVEPVTKTPEVLGAINELVGISFEEYLAPNQKAKKLGAKVISVINVVQVSPDIYKKLMIDLLNY